jgi:hypothetical protein
MKVATVFVARSKVQRMLREELERLERREAANLYAAYASGIN